MLLPQCRSELQRDCTCAVRASWHDSQPNSPPREASVVSLMGQRVGYMMGSHGSWPCGPDSARVFLSILHFPLILTLFCFSLLGAGRVSSDGWWWRETGSRVSKAGFELSIAEEELELLTLLPSPLQCWGHRHAPPYRVIVVLETNPGLHTC